jgi:hypothetical protein
MSPQDVRADDVGCSRETDQERNVRGMVANSPTMDVDGNAKMPMAIQTQCNERVKISRRMLGAWCTPRPVETSADHTARVHRTLKKLGFEGEKGQLREWMTVAQR